ncbi:MAG TPA: respiratory nitrate reductase subunit gamma [Candidatus Nanoarchaeia archaeon]|nr:respiratory nitrate reductase subunit gamma [Candidatus Nanoarchaeia archaeon]
MTLAVYICLYTGLVVFAFGCVWRIAQHYAIPKHLRHKPFFRTSDGGGMEPRKTVWELLVLKRLWQLNRSHWYASIMFHFGVYLCALSAVLVSLSAADRPLIVPGHEGTMATYVPMCYRTAGVIGAAMTASGGGLLLFRRLTNVELRNYTNASDIFDLVLLTVTPVILEIGYLTRPEGASVAELTRKLFRFDLHIDIGNVFGIGLILFSLLVGYFPWSRMSHCLGAYFRVVGQRHDYGPISKGQG